MTTISTDTKLLEKIFKSQGIKDFFSQYNVLMTVLLVLVSMLAVALFLVNVAKLSNAGDNERKRQEAKDGILACIICGEILGAIDVVYAILAIFVFG